MLKTRKRTLPHYSRKQPSRDGTGKVYMGREMSQVVGHTAVRWLERPEREREDIAGRSHQEPGTEAR